ncbi:putative cation efflux protein [Firmicutes bacterium CAG:555]|nr:putative cation efflux protein [Firmicutes bacterium CAG:555]
MVSLLSKIFIKNRDDVTDPAVRKAYGSLCSALGIVLNVLLFAGKYIAGAVSGSIAITADAFNNLSDAGSSAISLVGFHLSSKKPDLDHPFGHGRLEYISGLCVAALILVMGVELLISSVQKIITPEPVETGLLPAAILIVSIAVKVYMSAYNRSVGKKISSSAMQATAAGSLSGFILAMGGVGFHCDYGRFTEHGRELFL